MATLSYSRMKDLDRRYVTDQLIKNQDMIPDKIVKGGNVPGEDGPYRPPNPAETPPYPPKPNTPKELAFWNIFKPEGPPSPREKRLPHGIHTNIINHYNSSGSMGELPEGWTREDVQEYIRRVNTNDWEQSLNNPEMTIAHRSHEGLDIQGIPRYLGDSHDPADHLPPPGPSGIPIPSLTPTDYEIDQDNLPGNMINPQDYDQDGMLISQNYAPYDEAMKDLRIRRKQGLPDKDWIKELQIIKKTLYPKA